MNSFALLYDTEAQVIFSPPVLTPSPSNFSVIVYTDIEMDVTPFSLIQLSGPGVLGLVGATLISTNDPPGTSKWEVNVTYTVAGTYTFNLTGHDVVTNTATVLVDTSTPAIPLFFDVVILLPKISRKSCFNVLRANILKPIDPRIRAFQIRVKGGLPWTTKPGWDGVSFLEPNDGSFLIAGLPDDTYGIYDLNLMSYIQINGIEKFPLTTTNLLTAELRNALDSSSGAIIRLEISGLHQQLIDTSTDRQGTRYAMNVFAVDDLWIVSPPLLP
jgi:hypothetical protein